MDEVCGEGLDNKNIRKTEDSAMPLGSSKNRITILDNKDRRTYINFVSRKGHDKYLFNYLEV